MRLFFKLKKVPVAPPEESERTIALAGHRVDYKLVRRRGRRGVGLKVDGTGMTVAASLTTPIGSIEDMIGRNSNWVLKKLNEWAHRRIQPQRWETGAHVHFLGEPLTLMIDEGATRVSVEQSMGHLFIRLAKADPSAIEKAAQAWYKRQAPAASRPARIPFFPAPRTDPASRIPFQRQQPLGKLQFAARGAIFMAPHQGAARVD